MRILGGFESFAGESDYENKTIDDKGVCLLPFQKAHAY